MEHESVMRQRQQWLREEAAWEEQEPDQDDQKWVRQGEKIYRELLRLDPAELRYRVSLSAILRSHGRYEKMRTINHVKARRIFDEVLAIEPDHPETHYHLGHLDLHDLCWREALSHFDRVLGSAAHRVTNVQRIRSLCASAIACLRLGHVEHAKERLSEARKQDTDRGFRIEIDSIWHLIPSEEPTAPGSSDRRFVKDFVVVTHDGQCQARWREVATLMEEQGYIQLDLTGRRQFIGPDLRQVALGDSQAHILLCLLQRAGQPVSATDLRDFIDRGQTVGAVKTHISRLRERLQRCLVEPVGEVLTTERHDGYMWCHPLPYRIYMLADE